MMNKLAIGTVQFGLQYGITNTVGKVSPIEVRKILKLAAKAGVDTLDTAINYGGSEQCLGDIGVPDWLVVSKLPKRPLDCVDTKDWLFNEVEHSLKRLKLSQLYGVLLHQPNELSTDYGLEIWQGLNELKSNGLVQKIGYSIYEPEDLDQYFLSFPPDLVQAPYNVFDRRLDLSGWFEKLSNEDVEIHIRSIFLQGLLVANFAQDSSKFKPWESLFTDWSRWLKDHDITAVEGCMNFALSNPYINKVVVGIDSVAQLQEILLVNPSKIDVFPKTLMTDDKRLLNPSYWEHL